MYNTVMKVLFLASSGYIVYLMKYKRPICSSYDKVQDSFNVLYLIVPCVIVGLGVHMMQIYLYEDSFSLFEVRKVSFPRTFALFFHILIRYFGFSRFTLKLSLLFLNSKFFKCLRSRTVVSIKLVFRVFQLFFFRFC
jgi:hypothetical protein